MGEPPAEGRKYIKCDEMKCAWRQTCTNVGNHCRGLKSKEVIAETTSQLIRSGFVLQGNLMSLVEQDYYHECYHGQLIFVRNHASAGPYHIDVNLSCSDDVIDNATTVMGHSAHEAHVHGLEGVSVAQVDEPLAVRFLGATAEETDRLNVPFISPSNGAVAT